MPPSARDVFVAFFAMNILGFGGVLPFVRRMLVEEKGWLTEREFVEALALCQFLPGPNIVNLSIVVGRRFAGLRGALCATAGAILLPFLVIVTLGAIYLSYGHLPIVREAFTGIAAAAAGLIMATATKMARALRWSWWNAAIAATVFIAIAWFRLPLIWLLVAVAPVAVALASRFAAHDAS